MTCRNVTYRGTRGDDTWTQVAVVVTDNDRREPERPLEHHVHHSPTGFSWGYHGSGPAELARCILWDHLHAEPHPAVYQHFKATVIGSIDAPAWSISSAEVAGWLLEYQHLHPDAVLTMGTETGART